MKSIEDRQQEEDTCLDERVKETAIIEQVLKDPDYSSLLEQLEQLEAERIYCKHDRAHLQEVAQIAGVVAKENQLVIPLEQIVFAAMFHDIGRVAQYQDGISHDQASAEIARTILSKACFHCSAQDIDHICEAIVHHSHRSNAKERYDNRGEICTLGELLSFADHFSRKCYACKAKNTCKWNADEKIQISMKLI